MAKRLRIQYSDAIYSEAENVASVVTFTAFYQDIPALSIWWLHLSFPAERSIPPRSSCRVARSPSSVNFTSSRASTFFLSLGESRATSTLTSTSDSRPSRTTPLASTCLTGLVTPIKCDPASPPATAEKYLARWRSCNLVPGGTKYMCRSFAARGVSAMSKIRFIPRPISEGWVRPEYLRA